MAKSRKSNTLVAEAAEPKAPRKGGKKKLVEAEVAVTEPAAVENATTVEAAGDAPEPEGGPITLEGLVEQYLDALDATGRSRGTVFAASLDLGIARRFFGDDTRLATLTPKKVSAYFESDAVTKKRTGDPKGQLTIDRTRRALRLCLRWAEEAGLVAKAPLPEEPAMEKKAKKPAAAAE